MAKSAYPSRQQIRAVNQGRALYTNVNDNNNYHFNSLFS